jgi:mannose-6-phosphate isomerase-like protein (cupin superfamily)
MALERIELFAPAGLRLHDGGAIDVEIPPRKAGDNGGWLMAGFHVESTQDVHGDHWEIHESSQEVVSVLSGLARLVLRARDAQSDEEMVTLPAGTAVVVPRGRWHRLEIDGPTDLLSISISNGSRLEPRA